MKSESVQDSGGGQHTGSDADAADAWVTELENRAREVRSGAVSTVDWESVRARLDDRWRHR